MSGHRDFAKTALCVAAAFLVGSAGRFAAALSFGPGGSAAPAPASDAPAVVAERASASDAALARGASREDAVAQAAAAPAPADACVAPPFERRVDLVAAVPLGQTSAFDGPPLVEEFDAAAARCSARNAAHSSALATSPFRFLAYRAGDRFETTCGDLARQYSASPETWMGVLAADNDRTVPPAGETPPFDAARLGAAQCASLRAAVLDYVRGAAALRRGLFGALASAAAAERPPALDPRTTSAVFAGESGVAVVAAGADAELDRMLDELGRLERSARSDVEFVLR